MVHSRYLFEMDTATLLQKAWKFVIALYSEILVEIFMFMYFVVEPVYVFCSLL